MIFLYLKDHKFLYTSTVCTSIIILLCWCMLVFPPALQASLDTYIRKYQGKPLPVKALARLRKYDALINYFTSITYFDTEHRVSAEFIRALILAESNANHSAISSKDAIGLGQICLETGRQAARELWSSGAQFLHVEEDRLQHIKQEDLFDPALNILLTCYLINKYNQRFKGRLDLVVSAWNAGENHIMLEDRRYAPYPETQNLIGRVNRYYLALLQDSNTLGQYPPPPPSPAFQNGRRFPQ